MFQRPRSDSVDSVTGAKRAGRASAEGVGLWTDSEHERFMQAIAIYPKGPWRLVADYVGTRNARQTMTHAQKYKQKIARRTRGLRTPGRVPRRLRQGSITESESGSEYAEPALVHQSSARPSLPVFVRTGVPHDPVAAVLAEVFGGGLSPLRDTDYDASLWTALAVGGADDAELFSLDSDLLALLDLDCPSSPTSPADHADAFVDDDMSFEELLNLTLLT